MSDKGKLKVTSIRDVSDGELIASIRTYGTFDLAAFQEAKRRNLRVVYQSGVR